MKSPARCLLLLCFAFAPPPAVAQQADDIVVTTHHIDAVRNARTPWDEVQNCLKDNACAGAIKLIAGQVGIPDNAVRLVETAAIYSAKAEGEETRYTVRAVSSRKICSVKVRTISVVPATATAPRCSPSAPARILSASTPGRRGRASAGGGAGTKAMCSSSM